MERTLTVANGTRLCIDEIGSAGSPLIVHLEGHMAQLISTPRSYAERLAESGYRVVRVDNRDVGGSDRFPGVAYTLTDMVEDVHGLIAELGGPALVCGRSMGGAIAQLLTLMYPGDVAGLGLFFTFATERPSRAPGPVAQAPFHDEVSFLAWERQSLPTIAGSGYPYPPDDITWLASTMWRRGVDWGGFERQRRAMGEQAPWADRLGDIAVPTVIVHGDEDPVVPVESSRRLAELIPGADLRIVPGMGHQQPPELDEFFVAATLATVGH